jgi:hypothetical protein
MTTPKPPAPTDAGRVGVLERLLKRASDYLETANQIIIEDAGGDEEDFRDADESASPAPPCAVGTRRAGTPMNSPMRERAEALALALASKTYSEVAPFRQEVARLIERALLAAYQQGQRDMRERVVDDLNAMIQSSKIIGTHTGLLELARNEYIRTLGIPGEKK